MYTYIAIIYDFFYLYIHGTNSTSIEPTLDTSVGNLNKNAEKLIVDSFLEPILVVMDLYTFILNRNQIMLITYLDLHYKHHVYNIKISVSLCLNDSIFDINNFIIEFMVNIEMFAANALSGGRGVSLI